jgi:hypothetical protein
VVACIGRSGCRDQDCVNKACAAEVGRCATSTGTATAAASPEPAGAPAAPAAPSAPAQPAAGARSSVGVADMVGLWNQTQATTQDFVDSSTGAFVASSATFYGESYDIAADGSFDYKFVGRSSNYTVREGEKGSISFAGGFMVVSFPKRLVDPVLQRRVMSYFTTTDGTTILVTVPAVSEQKEVNWDDPAYVANFCGPPGKQITSCVGGETWIRSRP